MIWEIVKFELKYRSLRPVTYIYFFLLLVFSFLMASFADISTSESENLIYQNAPEIITILILVLTMIGTFIASAVMGVPVFRDYDHNFYEIIYSTKVKKLDYLWGRFIGSYLTSIFIFSGIIFGLMLGFSMPWLTTDSIGPFNLAAYLNPFFLYVIPNLFIIGCLFFIVGSYFKSQIAISLQGIFFISIFLIIGIAAENYEASPLKAMLDPLGFAALNYTIENWHFADKSTALVPINNIIITNRIVWLSTALVINLVFTWFFNIHPFGFTKGRKRKENKDFIPENALDNTKFVISRQGLGTRMLQWWNLTKFYFESIIRSIPFYVLISCGIGLILIVKYGQSLHEIPFIPVTFLKLEEVINEFLFFGIIIIIIYSGELIWKDIGNKFCILLDSSPVIDKNLLLSKFSAMILIELLILLIMALFTIVLQVFKGFYDFQPVLSLKVLLINNFPFLIFLTILIFLIHTIVNNKYLGHAIVIFLLICKLFTNKIGINHILFRYGNSITEPLSGMNELQKFIFPALSVDFYWLMLGIVFLVLSILIIKRGSDYSLKSRFSNLLSAWKKGKSKYIILSAILLFLASGSGIYYSTNVLNTYRTEKQERLFKAEYEKEFYKYKNVKQPRIVDVNVQVDIFPEEDAFRAKGTYHLINKSNQKIDTIHLRLNPTIKLDKVEFGIKSRSIVEAYEYGYYIYVLSHSLQPNDSLQFDFEIDYKERGFSYKGRDKFILPNGTFFSNELLPYFGYDESFVLTKNSDRKKVGLKERVFESADVHDTTFYYKNSINHNADKIRFEAIVSTSPDQIAITTGKLIKDWSENNRRFFQYKTEDTQWNAYPFVSAKYNVVTDTFKNIDVSIYYHEDHDYNLEKMNASIKKTMNYCEQKFSPYQPGQIRIVEIPRYFDNSYSYRGTLLFAENMLFVADENTKRNIDLPFYLTCFEIAKQWWSQQIAPANVKGKLLLTESLAEYTALMVMEKEYGYKDMQKFLLYNQDMYRINMAHKELKEIPLYLASEEEFVALYKGGLTFYTLKDYIGEKNMNRALRSYIQKYNQTIPPYPTSLNLLELIENEIPDSLHFLINDMFRSVVSYNNQVDSCYYNVKKNGLFEANIYVSCKKFRLDSNSKQEDLELSDWIDLGIYTRSADKKDSLVFLKKEYIDSKNSEFHIILKDLPYKAGIDPFYKLMDQDLSDNITKIKAKE